MALSVIQDWPGTESAASTTLTATTGTTTLAGDLIVVCIGVHTSGVSVTGVTDGAGNTYTKDVAATHSTMDGEIWWTANATATIAVTVTVSASADIVITVLEIGGAATSSPADVAAAAGSFGTAPASGSTATTAQADEIAIALITWQGSATLSGQTAGYTLLTEASSASPTNIQAAYQILAATGTQSYGGTLSASAAEVAAVATFKAASSGPTFLARPPYIANQAVQRAATW